MHDCVPTKEEQLIQEKSRKITIRFWISIVLATVVALLLVKPTIDFANQELENHQTQQSHRSTFGHHSHPITMIALLPAGYLFVISICFIVKRNSENKLYQDVALDDIMEAEDGFLFYKNGVIQSFNELFVYGILRNPTDRYKFDYEDLIVSSDYRFSYNELKVRFLNGKYWRNIFKGQIFAYVLDRNINGQMIITNVKMKRFSMNSSDGWPLNKPWIDNAHKIDEQMHCELANRFDVYVSELGVFDELLLRKIFNDELMKFISENSRDEEFVIIIANDYFFVMLNNYVDYFEYNTDFMDEIDKESIEEHIDIHESQLLNLKRQFEIISMAINGKNLKL